MESTAETSPTEHNQSPPSPTTTETPETKQQQSPITATTTKRKKSWYNIGRKLSFDTTFMNNKNTISPDYNNTDPITPDESLDLDFQRHPSYQDDSDLRPYDNQTNNNNNNSNQLPFLKSVRKKVKKAFNGKSNANGQGKLRKAASCSNLNQALYPYPVDSGENESNLDVVDNGKVLPTSSATLDLHRFRRKLSNGIPIPGKVITTSDYCQNDDDGSDGQSATNLSTSLSSLSKHELDDNNNQYNLAVIRSANENGAVLPVGGGGRARKVSWVGVIQPSINEDAILRTSTENPGVSGGKEQVRSRRKSRIEHANLFAASTISESLPQGSPDTSPSSVRPAWFPSDEECTSQAKHDQKSLQEQENDSSSKDIKECTDEKLVNMSKRNRDSNNINNSLTKSTANTDENTTSWNIIQYEFLDEKDNYHSNQKSDRRKNKTTATTKTTDISCVKETKNCKNKDSTILLSTSSLIKTGDNLSSTSTASTKEEKDTREKGPTTKENSDAIRHNGSEEAMRTLVARLAKAADNSRNNKAAGCNKRDASRKIELIEAGIDTRIDKSKQQNFGDGEKKITTTDIRSINSTTSVHQEEGGVREESVFETVKSQFPTVIDFSENYPSATSLTPSSKEQREKEEAVFETIKNEQNNESPTVINCSENDINEPVKTAEQNETETSSRRNNSHIMKSTHNDPNNNHHNYMDHENDMNNGFKERMSFSSTSSTTTADKAMMMDSTITKPKYIYSLQSTHNSRHNYVDDDTKRPLGKHLSAASNREVYSSLHFDINNNSLTAEKKEHSKFINSDATETVKMLGKNIVKKPYAVDELYIASRPGKSNGVAPSERENLFESNYLNHKNQHNNNNNNNSKTNLPTSKVSVPESKPVKVCTQQQQKRSSETVVAPQTTAARKIPLHVSVEDIQCLVEGILKRKLADKTFEEARVTTWCKEIVNTVRDQIKLITEESLSSRRKVIASAYIGPKTKENSVHVAIKCQKQMNTDDFITVAYESDSLFVWVSLMMAKY